MTWPKSCIVNTFFFFLGRTSWLVGSNFPSTPLSWDRGGLSPGPLEDVPALQEQDTLGSSSEAAGTWQRWYRQERGLTEDSHTPCSAAATVAIPVLTAQASTAPPFLYSQPAATPQRQMCLHHPYSGQQHWGPWRHAHALHMSTCIYLILTDFRTMSKELIKRNGKVHTHIYNLSLKIKGRNTITNYWEFKKKKPNIAYWGKYHNDFILLRDNGHKAISSFLWHHHQ